MDCPEWMDEAFWNTLTPEQQIAIVTIATSQPSLPYPDNLKPIPDWEKYSPGQQDMILNDPAYAGLREALQKEG